MTRREILQTPKDLKAGQHMTDLHLSTLGQKTCSRIIAKTRILKTRLEMINEAMRQPLELKVPFPTEHGWRCRTSVDTVI
jgi:hypothetical protein